MSERWKELERDTAKALGGQRHIRWFRFEKAPDVEVEAGPYRLIVDCKAWKKFAHHSLMDTIQRKYCTGNEIPVLVSKSEGQRGAYCTIPMSLLAELLERVRSHNHERISDLAGNDDDSSHNRVSD
jgi:hypothetical protein